MHKYISLFLLVVAWAMSGIVLADQGPSTIDSASGSCQFLVNPDGTRTDPIPCNPGERTTTYSGYQAFGSWRGDCIPVEGDCYPQPESYTVYWGYTTEPCFYNAPDSETYWTTNVMVILQPNQDITRLSISCADLQELPF